MFIALWLRRHNLNLFDHSSAIALAMGRKRDLSAAALAKLSKAIGELVEAEHVGD